VYSYIAQATSSLAICHFVHSLRNFFKKIKKRHFLSLLAFNFVKTKTQSIMALFKLTAKRTVLMA